MITFLQAAEVAVNEETRMGLWELFTKGGWLMWPLLILGGVTIFIFVERFLAIRKASIFDMNFMNRIRDFILDGKIAAAVDLCRKTDTPIARMVEKGIERLGRPMSDVQSAIENVANLEVSKLENGLPALATIAGGVIVAKDLEVKPVVVEEEDAGGVFPVDEGLEFVCVRGSAVQEEGVAEPLVAGAGVGAAFGEVEVVGEAVTDREVGPVVAAVGAAGWVNPGFSSALC